MNGLLLEYVVVVAARGGFCSRLLLLLSFAPLEHRGHERGAAAGPVLGQHQVELVVDAHQLADARLHDVLEVRVVPEERAVDGDDHVAVVHLLEQRRDARGGHERGAAADHLADEAQRGAVLVRHRLRVHAHLLQAGSGAGVLAHGVGLDLAGVTSVERACQGG